METYGNVWKRMETYGLLDAKHHGIHKRICRYGKHINWIRMNYIRVVHLGSTLDVSHGFISNNISMLLALRKI